MATLPQYNSAMGAYNNALHMQQYGGGPAGTGSAWSQYNSILDKYGIGNGSTSGVGGGSYPAAGGAGGAGGIGSYGGGGQSGGGPVNFTLNPGTQAGSGTFGAVPGAIGAPPSLWDETNSAVPGMAGLTGQTSGLIGHQLNGDLSPSTIGNLTDAAAARGVQLGQGGSTGLTNEILLKTLGLTHEQLQQQGQSNYLNFLGATSSLQQKPDLLAEIASRNATMAAAPNPTMAANYLMGLSRGSGTSLRQPSFGGGSGGGYGGYGGGAGSRDANLGAGVDPALYQHLYGGNFGMTNSGGYQNRGYQSAGGYQGDYSQVDNVGAQDWVNNYLDPNQNQFSSGQDQNYEDLWTD